MPNSPSDLWSSHVDGDFPRDTLVVEAILSRPLGFGREGEDKAKRCLGALSGIIGLTPLQSPVTHRSSKYGLSGWVPLENCAALHLYAWDEEERETRPFISVDISTPWSLSDRLQVVEQLRSFLGSAPDATVYKALRSSSWDNACTWKELAKHIVRQRLAIVGKPSTFLGGREVKAYLGGLCDVLRMDRLSDFMAEGDAAWMHWETSGAVASWKEDAFAIDIYTCKAFKPADAIRYTRMALNLEDLVFKEF